MRAISPSFVTPALLTTTSSSPALSTSARACSASDTSACSATAPVSAATSAASASPERYEKVTRAPARASSATTARPIPREPPVTSACLSASDPYSGSGERLLRLLQARHVVDRNGLDVAVDALHEAGEDVARPDLDERAHAVARERAGGLREANGGRQLVDEHRAQALRGLDLRRHRRHERCGRVAEANALDCRPQAIRRAGDERAVEGARDAKLDGAARAFESRLRAALVDRPVLAGHDDLTGAVVIRG